MSFILTFFEGILSFVSPCLLPLLPLYLSFLGGGKKEGKMVIINSLAFVLGFSSMFILLGAFSSSLGYFLRQYQRIIEIFSGFIIIFLSLIYLGFIKLPYSYCYQHKIEKVDLVNSILFGIVFALGWTPCIGAFLGSALMLAATSANLGKGIILLATYSLGLAIPFVLSAILFERLQATFLFIKKNYGIITTVSGSFLFIMGILMILGLFEKVIYIF